MNIETTNPLQWPHSWARSSQRLSAKYGEHSIAKCVRELCNQLRLLGASNVVISSNLKARIDGLPIRDQRQPDDRGVAVYFRRKGRVQSFACDKWDKIEHNIWAIAQGISALRQLERTGMSEMLERAFLGFAALPAPEPILSWWQVLGVSENASFEEVRKAYLKLIKSAHPDVGGSKDKFEAVQRAYMEATAEKSGVMCGR
jgi:hypothetical protein